MNTQRKLIAALSLCAAATFPGITSAAAISGQGTWETTLLARDLDGDLATAEAYYDTVLNITWLADANYAQTAGFDSTGSTGSMLWDEANSWVASLNFNGIGGWRLPFTLDPDYSCLNQGGSVPDGANCTGSEMGSLFYNTLGNTFDSITNTGPFTNIQNYYWSATEYSLDPERVWYFFFMQNQ